MGYRKKSYIEKFEQKRKLQEKTKALEKELFEKDREIVEKEKKKEELKVSIRHKIIEKKRQIKKQSKELERKNKDILKKYGSIAFNDMVHAVKGKGSKKGFPIMIYPLRKMKISL